MPYGMILEAIVAILLMVTVGYCFVLDRRLQALRSGREELQKVVEDLNGSIARAQTTILDLKANAGDTARLLEERVAKAQGLADELALMVQSGNSIAERLADRPSAAKSAPRSEPTTRSTNRPEEAERQGSPIESWPLKGTEAGSIVCQYSENRNRQDVYTRAFITRPHDGSSFALRSKSDQYLDGDD